ncbi:MAG: 4-(cytidine 5'-diphospho)-2-C-methyl-D-erythritol kinase [Opitutales bacterium]
MPSVSIFSPAKINLFLAITGRRADGYHDLVSLVAPLAWGDTLTAEPAPAWALTCTDPAVPLDDSNLVLRAAAAFRAATGWAGAAAFHLTKRIPMGAGLGGGSSNAVATLRALNELAGHPLDGPQLQALSAPLGSDCPLFAVGGPVVLRGRGEQVEALAAAEHARLRGRPVLVFKPDFGVATAWAYRALAASPGLYVPAAQAEARLDKWCRDETAGLAGLLGNSLEPVVAGKYLALPAMYRVLRERFGLAPCLSGSGSASFVLPAAGTPLEAVAGCIREAWGPEAVVVVTNLV